MRLDPLRRFAPSGIFVRQWQLARESETLDA